ncbi:uncharacterized protein LOC124932004 [Impatiens glandulifera]|uniref:uncharacterized protein LOC124932004 n=1 Tax=Impatiens glandulifera TaxID=253017 RepID=UPI001FB0AF36|nr:uncharacterized protein LOC124932004 [Impatiens glandulifera]
MMANETGREFAQIVVESNDETEMIDSISSNRRNYCFCIPCFKSNRSSTTGSNWWHRIREAEQDERWWSKGITAFKKVREWSEIVAGPRWKTFIRRFNRNKNGGGGKHGKFNYDPLSYSLNFDEGTAATNGDSDEEYGFRNFSSRYASIPNTAKSSIDYGKDQPTFT